MKISYQWILAAIIVLLIILVGAYALTNGNNTPATNATATPTITITPTATTVASPSAAPSTAASATPAATTKPTPTATPTISGSSGVRQTEFGYYITYPPFSDNEVHVNPGYVATQGDVVYFSPTSATITKYALYGAERTPDAVAVVHRSGNLSGITHVTILAAINDYIDDLGFTNPVNGNLVSVSFAPGESEKTVGIYVYQEERYSSAGQVTLTIINVDGVDSIGSNNVFTLTVNQPSVSPSPSSGGVQFISNGGNTQDQLYSDGSPLGWSVVDHSTPSFEVDIVLTRTSTTGSLSPNVVISDTNMLSSDFYIEEQPTFTDGQATATLEFVYNLEYTSEDDHPYVTLSISPSSAYTIGTNNPFYLDTYTEW